MTDQDSDVLGLDEVTRRFADSEQALGRVREQLESLTSAAERTQTSTAALEDAAASIKLFVDSAGHLVGELGQVQTQARSVLEAGARFLDGTELGELRKSLSELADTTSAKSEALEASVAGTRGVLEQRLVAVEERLATLEEASARVAQVETEVRRIYATLPDRWKKKA